MSKAVSPLIATVILVAFSVVLGGFVMSWGKNFINKQTTTIDAESGKQTQCSVNLGLAFVELDDDYMACYDSSGITMTIQNVGTVNITGIKVQVSAVNGSVQNSPEISVMIKSGEGKKLTVDNIGTGGVRHLSVIPKVEIPGTSSGAFCVNKMLELDDLNMCS
ncbi:MAG: archaellin/type IV pilin N-terminal domain-containing protein [archaeon]